MCLDREVRVSLVLSSWITVLCCGTGVFGKEMAWGASNDAAHAASLARCIPLDPCSCVLGSTLVSGEGWSPSSEAAGGSYSTLSAMAIPDGPGAVCLGILGFVCVSAMKNRRAWIGLCLCVLSCSRVGAARLAKAGVAGPDRVDPDWPGNRESEPSPRGDSLPEVCRLSSPLNTPRLLILGPCYPHSSLPCDNPGLKGLPPRTDAASANSWETGPSDLGATAPVGSLSVERVGLARPPPRRPQTTQDEMD
jgi:hypothetical protein